MAWEINKLTWVKYQCIFKFFLFYAHRIIKDIFDIQWLEFAFITKKLVPSIHSITLLMLCSKDIFVIPSMQLETENYQRGILFRWQWKFSTLALLTLTLVYSPIYYCNGREEERQPIWKTETKGQNDKFPSSHNIDLELEDQQCTNARRMAVSWFSQKHGHLSIK